MINFVFAYGLIWINYITVSASYEPVHVFGRGKGYITVTALLFHSQDGAPTSTKAIQVTAQWAE